MCVASWFADTPPASSVYCSSWFAIVVSSVGYVPPCSVWYRSIAFRSVARSPASAESPAPAAPRLIRGTAIAAMIPMITTTMTSSIRLNARRARFPRLATIVDLRQMLRPLDEECRTLELPDHRPAAPTPLDTTELHPLRGPDRPHTPHARLSFPPPPPLSLRSGPSVRPRAR